VDDFSAWETPSSFIPNTVHENDQLHLMMLAMPFTQQGGARCQRAPGQHWLDVFFGGGA
jgi:hypothetical protein